MADLYEQITPPQQRKAPSGTWKLMVLLAIGLLLLLLCIVPVARILGHQYGYKRFVSALSTQTYQCYYQDNLRAEVDGTSLRITGDNAYVVYNAISALGPGKLPGNPPQEPPDAVLYYGDEAMMKLWSVALSQADRRPSGVYVEFDGPEGDFSYIINGKDMSYFSAALSPEKNPAWEG